MRCENPTWARKHHFSVGHWTFTARLGTTLRVWLSFAGSSRCLSVTGMLWVLLTPIHSHSALIPVLPISHWDHSSTASFVRHRPCERRLAALEDFGTPQVQPVHVRNKETGATSRFEVATFAPGVSVPLFDTDYVGSASFVIWFANSNRERTTETLPWAKEVHGVMVDLVEELQRQIAELEAQESPSEARLDELLDQLMPLNRAENWYREYVQALGGELEIPRFRELYELVDERP